MSNLLQESRLVGQIPRYLTAYAGYSYRLSDLQAFARYICFNTVT